MRKFLLAILFNINFNFSIFSLFVIYGLELEQFKSGRYIYDMQAHANGVRR